MGDGLSYRMPTMSDSLFHNGLVKKLRLANAAGIGIHRVLMDCVSSDAKEWVT